MDVLIAVGVAVIICCLHGTSQIDTSGSESVTGQHQHLSHNPCDLAISFAL